jgi:hypothetical protein
MAKKETIEEQTEQAEHPQRVIERRVAGGGPRAHRHPNVRGGICDFCGVLDSKKPSLVQYRLCKHYSDLPDPGLQCTYCPEGVDVDDVILHRVLTVYELADKPGELIVHCDDYNCRQKHLQRFTAVA